MANSVDYDIAPDKWSYPSYFSPKTYAYSLEAPHQGRNKKNPYFFGW